MEWIKEMVFNTKNLMTQVNSRFSFLLFLCFFVSCKEKRELDVFINDLTNNKAEMWDYFYVDSLIEQKNAVSFLFYKNGRCEIYSISVRNGERIAQYSDRPIWKMESDSIIEMLCYNKYKIVSYGRDSIVLRKTENPGVNEVMTLYRVNADWNINQKSVIRRDSLEVALKGRDNPCVIY
ncbi:hypothetical protein [Flavobacterium sp. NKUCC04_CG]|uniref:hypothetical protein n=1 Tax=Flavobacterium sp. NKUCC04_CG TaxID=2842121 RepID=UPI001C5A7CD7|nr:hypothetical protein [Flavobacterium sp. NKUCC04_CG]MBW3519875.1 hypothetical protein [Flavobacterium sp. NKUCC04_CG]